MDKKIGELLNTLENTPPQADAKARIYRRLQAGTEPELNRFQRLLYTNPLAAAGIIAVMISGMLWVITGSNYTDLMISFFSVG